MQRILNQMIHNTAKPRGRPRSFDETGALEKATQVFWSKGYDGVTIDDLVAGMGVGRPSLYAVFGDKRTLFLRVLKDYAEKKGARAAKALLSPQALRDSIAGFLRYAVESATEKGSAWGCLLVCVAPLVNDAEVQRFLQSTVAGGATHTRRQPRADPVSVALSTAYLRKPAIESPRLCGERSAFAADAPFRPAYALRARKNIARLSPKTAYRLGRPTPIPATRSSIVTPS